MHDRADVLLGRLWLRPMSDHGVQVRSGGKSAANVELFC